MHNLALFNRGGTAEIGVSQNLVSSSLLPATDALIQAHEPVLYMRRDTVSLARLDSIWSDVVPQGSHVHLKLDVQGAEAAVINSARGVLAQISTIRMEVAVTEVYEGETILPDMIRKITVLGFDVIGAGRHGDTPKQTRCCISICCSGVNAKIRGALAIVITRENRGKNVVEFFDSVGL